jgi:CHAT domain-containing protein
MKKIIFLFFISTICYGQNEVDSLVYYYQKGYYSKAINYGEKQKKTFKIKGTEYALIVNNLASAYGQIGDFKNAELNYLEELELEKSFFGENHKIVANTYQNLGNCLSNSTDLIKAKLYFMKAVEIYQKNDYFKTIDYTDCLLNLGVLLKDLKDYETAELVYENAIQLLKKYQGENSINHFKGLLSLAIFYHDIKNDYKSKIIISQITDYFIINKDSLLFNNRQNVFFLFNVAELLKNNKDYKNAKIFYEKTIDLANLYIPKSEIIYSDILYYTSLFYHEIKETEKAIELYKKILINYNFQVFQKTNYYTFNELSKFKNEFYYRIFPIISFLQSYPTQHPEINIGCYENDLLIKNLTLRNQQRIKNSIAKSSNTELQNKYEQFIVNKRYLTKQEELSPSERNQNYEEIKGDTEILEKDITRLSSEFSDAKKAMTISIKDIQQKLKADEVVIDFVHFNYYNKKWTDSTMYAAFVYSKTSKFPKFIKLFEEKQLSKLLVNSDNQEENSRFDKLYLNNQLTQLLFKPLENELIGMNTIYLSLSGLTHQINTGALILDNEEVLGKKYKLHIINSPATLVAHKPLRFDEQSNLAFHLYGGIDYDKKNETSPNEIQNQNDIVVSEASTSLQTRSGISGFGYLSGTKNEIQNIQSITQKNGFQTNVFDDRRATEESIKKLDGTTTPFVLHLATHGFFFPDPVHETPNEQLFLETKSRLFKASDDPMLRSGLLFSGANKFWGKSNEKQTGDDGILTASEISNLDLSACQLVVLSACETGLGEVKGSEGVFGLQRAFKMAGVKNIIMSLWKVPDTQTAELFNLFYEECFAGKTIHEAFQSAQAKMRAKYSPYYWAGFILLE